MVHNVGAGGGVTLRYGRRRHAYTVRQATPTEAADHPVVELQPTSWPDHHA